jgi:hypothetical protein
MPSTGSGPISTRVVAGHGARRRRDPTGDGVMGSSPARPALRRGVQQAVAERNRTASDGVAGPTVWLYASGSALAMPS